MPPPDIGGMTFKITGYKHTRKCPGDPVVAYTDPYNGWIISFGDLPLNHADAGYQAGELKKTAATETGAKFTWKFLEKNDDGKRRIRIKGLPFGGEKASWYIDSYRQWSPTGPWVLEIVWEYTDPQDNCEETVTVKMEPV